MGPSAGGPSTSSLSNKPLRTQKEIGGKRFRVSGYDQYTPARRRRQRRRRIGIAAGLCVVLLAVGGWFGYQQAYGGKSHDKAAAAALCGKTVTTGKGASGRPTTTATTKPADPKALTPHQVTVNVYNATSRTGLAAITANELRSRGFRIGKVANDPVQETVTSSALVRGSAADLARLQFVEAQIGGSIQGFDHRTNATIDLVVGNRYHALSTPAQVAAAVRAATAADAKKAAKPACH